MNTTNEEVVLEGRMCLDDQTRDDLSDYLASVSQHLSTMRSEVQAGSCVSDLLDHSAAIRAAMSTFADAIGRSDATTCGGACLNAAARTRLQRVATALRSLQK